MSTSHSNNDQSSFDAVLQLLSSLTLSHDEAQNLIQVIADGSGVPLYSSSSNNSALDSPTSTAFSISSTMPVLAPLTAFADGNGLPSSPSPFNSTVLDSPASTVSTIASSSPAAALTAAEVALRAASTTASATPTALTTVVVTSPAAVPAAPQVTPADPIAPQPAVVHNHPAPAAHDDFAHFPHLPTTTVIINGEVRMQQHYCGFSFDVPHTGALGPFYLVTRGRRVGIFHTWQRTSPHVIGVSCSTYSRIKSLQDGLNRMLDAIDLGEAQWLP